MANAERYVIQFDARGVPQVTRAIKGAGAAAGQASKQFNLLGRALLALGTYMSVRQVIEYGDAWTNLTNKIKVVTNGEKQLIDTRKALIDISNRTRTSLEGNVTLYQRLGLANQNLGKSEKELLQFTEAISKSLAVSGATAQETRSVLIQLAQGLGSDAVRGEEFRAVMESGGRVMKALADATGLTTGELKNLTAEGKFLSEDFFDAVLSQIPAINRDFEKLTKTVSSAGAVFSNNLKQWIGEMNETTGAADKLASGIITLSENFNTIALAVVAIGFGALLVNITAVTAGLTAMATAIAPVVVGFAQLALTAAIVFGLTTMAQTFFTEVNTGANILIAFGQALESIRVVSVDVWEGMGDATRDASRRMANNMLSIINKIQNAFVLMWRNIKNASTLNWADVLNPEQFRAEMEKLANEFDATLVQPAGDGFAELADKIARDLDGVADAFAAVRAESDATIDNVTPLGEKFFSGFEENFQKVKDMLIEVQEISSNPMDAISDDPSAASGFGGGGGEGGGFMESMRGFLFDITDLGDQAWESVGRIADPETWAGLMDTMSDTVSVDTFFGGIAEGFEKSAMSAEKFKAAMVELTMQGIKGFSDELTLALTGGEADFKGFALSIVRQLISIMIQAMITGAIMAAFGLGGAGALGGSSGGGGGSSTAGVMSQLAGYQGKQFGGPVQAGQPTLVGERRPEIFVPQTAGTIEPRVDGAGQSQPAPSIVNVVDEQMYYDAMASTEGERVIMNVINRNS